MKRQVIKIDEEKCIGCELCASACKEGAIGIVDGKAKLLREDYCDGLGNCLPVCPTEAISFEEREVEPFKKETFTCPSQVSKTFEREEVLEKEINVLSELRQWPIQIKLAPVNAPYFHNANLLVAADCTAFSYGNFHKKFMKNKVTLIGCPKLDNEDYSNKLTQILSNNDIKSVTVSRMEVPCCGGIENAVVTTLKNSGKMIPWQIVTISTDGKILE